MHAPGQRNESRVRSGFGMHLTLEDGRTVVDVGSMSSCILGHCHPEVVAAVETAARTIYANDGSGYAPREQAAEDLLQIAFRDEPWADAVALFVSSSEAADLGLLLAQILTGREPLVSRELSYHGGVGLAREISRHPLWGGHLASLEEGVTARPAGLVTTRVLPVPMCGFGRDIPGHDCLDTCLANAPLALADAAAVMMDYSQGGVCPTPQYQDKLAAIARDAGCLWIADETVTAFGRMGRDFAFQRGETRPDAVTLGKGITAGAAPGGALVLSRELVEAIGDRRWMTAATYRGNPITVAAMSAVQQVLEREGLVARAASLGAPLGRDIKEVGARHVSVESVAGEGFMWIIRLSGSPRHSEENWAGDGRAVPPAQIVHEVALDHGVFIGILGGGSVWVIPPLIATGDQLALAVEALDAALDVADRAFGE